MPAEHHSTNAAPPGRYGRSRVDVVIVLAALAICSAIVAGLAWVRPTTTASSISYTQSGRLTYGATTSPGSVYGTAGLTTGEPIYGSVVNAVTVSYTYTFQTAAAASLSGTEQLVASISNGQGITHAIPIQSAAAPFTGEGFTVRGTLRLAALDSAASAFDQVSGRGGGGQYVVAVLPSVSVRGRLGGEPLTASFDSPINFNYSGGDVVPGSSGGSLGAQGGANFDSSSTDAVTVPAGRPATLLLGLSISSARMGSVMVLGVSLLLLGFAGWPLLREATSEDERQRITARYGSSIVEADDVAAHAGVVVVELGSFEGLAQVSRRIECPILHWASAGDVYAVIDGGTLYRYRISPALEMVRRGNGTANGMRVSTSREVATPERRSASDLVAVIHRAEGGHRARRS